MSGVSSAEVAVPLIRLNVVREQLELKYAYNYKSHFIKCVGARGDPGSPDPAPFIVQCDFKVVLQFPAEASGSDAATFLGHVWN